MKKARIVLGVAWGNSINLSGLYSNVPIRCILHKDSGNYWCADGNFNITKLGSDIRDGVIRFSSSNRKDVELWTDGVISAMILLRKWCRTR